MPDCLNCTYCWKQRTPFVGFLYHYSFICSIHKWQAFWYGHKPPNDPTHFSYTECSSFNFGSNTIRNVTELPELFTEPKKKIVQCPMCDLGHSPEKEAEGDYCTPCVRKIEEMEKWRNTEVSLKVSLTNQKLK